MTGHPTEQAKPRFAAGAFAAPTADCDLVMKGGVTSGVVYPYAILELAQAYRFRSIGGTSAGAIAAAFAAAAEYARRQGDPAGFVRLEERCLDLPAILEGLFQPSRPFAPLMDAIKGWSSTKSWTRWPRTLGPLWRSWIVGGLLGAAAMAALTWLAAGGGPRPSLLVMVPSAALGLAVGAALGLFGRISSLIAHDLPRHGFGFCSGLTSGGSAPVLTEWIHGSLQYIAFGAEDAPTPLTFGHLARAATTPGQDWDGHAAVELKMMTTNLSMRRPHVLPEIGGDFRFEAGRWARLFPPAVMAYLQGTSPHARREVAPEDKEYGGFRKCPQAEDWPVLCAVRMSLSFPVLLETVPLATRDLSAVADKADLDETARPAVPLRETVFSDGGLTSNFPIHFFDAFLPTRPTFALSLDQLLPGDDPARRVSLPQTAAAGSFSQIRPIDKFLAFAGAILDSAKDWQDQMTSEMPGQRERIVRVKLDKKEGGLNLAMPAETSHALMAYGAEAGAMLRTGFNFDEHRWRRTLVAYRHLERAVTTTAQVWPAHGAWLQGYAPHALTYKRVTKGDRAAIISRFGQFAGLAPTFQPIKNPDGKFPKPAGRLRIVPEV